MAFLYPFAIRWAVLALAVASAATAASQTLRIESEPSGARVEVDGVHVGQTPTAVTVTAGRHVVQLARIGYAPWEQTVEISPGVDAAVLATLERPTGTFEVEGLPPGARVTLDGEPVSGVTAARAGGVVLRVEVPNRDPFEVGVPVASGAETVATYHDRQFQPQLVNLMLTVPGGVQILDDRPVTGVVLLSAVTAGIATAAVRQFAYSDNETDFRNAVTLYASSTSEAEAVDRRAQIDAFVTRSGEIRRVQRGALAVAGLVYLASVADATLHHLWKPGVSVTSPRYPTVSLAGVGARLSLPL